MGLCIFFDIIYIKCKAQKRNIIGLFAKCLAAFCFITIGYMNYLNNTNSFNYYILTGLILDGIGDFFLALRNILAKNVTFIIGTLFFLVGHIVYIRALFILSNLYVLNEVILAVIIGSIIYYLLKKQCNFSNSLSVIGIIYLIFISLMALMAVGVYYTNPINGNLLFAIGALMFVASDIILVMNNFSKKAKWMHPVYSLLYFIAQLLISFSLGI